MTKDGLKKQIKHDLLKIGMKIDFELELRDYSKTYHGRYDPEKSKVILYVKDKQNNYLAYNVIITHAVHEAVHHLQWKHDDSWERKYGVMHDEEFENLFSEYKAHYFRQRENWERDIVAV